MTASAISLLRRVKRAASAFLTRLAVRRDAARAFRYDMAQFMEELNK